MRAAMSLDLADPSARRRKATGAYYTPAPLIKLLLDHAVSPLVERQNGSPLRILDPACGAGYFLSAARARLGDSAVLYGVDLDRDAVDRCRAATPGAQVVTADALLDPPAFFHDGFDLVLGNPPFVNGVESLFLPGYKQQLRQRYPDVRGAADLAHFFLRQAIDLVRPGGRIAMVLPRQILNSPAAQPLRAKLPPHLKPNLIYVPERSNFFSGAAVFICLLILGPDDTCLVSTDADPARATFRPTVIRSQNWWAAVHFESVAPTAPHRTTLADVFDLRASMIAADAYHLVPLIVDDADAPGVKLVTTGLIDPRACHWGRRPCRYLRRDYLHPRVTPGGPLTKSLAGRLATARRPKVILAGLTRRMEAFLDLCGEYIGAVSTYSIYHPRDDAAALEKLLDHLLSPSTTEHLIRQLGANGLRGRHITLKKEFLKALPLPDWH
jgi:SAM-dependent methyltransferase